MSNNYTFYMFASYNVPNIRNLFKIIIYICFFTIDKKKKISLLLMYVNPSCANNKYI